MSEQFERRALTVFSTTKDRRVAHTGGQGNSSEESAEYARRLVACWNACADIPTEVLESFTGEFKPVSSEALSGDLLARATDAERLLWLAVNGWEYLMNLATVPPSADARKCINDIRAFLAGAKPQENGK